MKNISLRTFIFLSGFILLLAGCTSTESLPTSTLIPSPKTTSTLLAAPEATLAPDENPAPFPTNIRIEDDTEYYIPHMLGFDGIRPVYNPTFSSANEAPMQDDELVMGLAIDGESKAYPVTVLRFREMVNDEIAGWPVLVSW
ncbi:MAG: DUF3179 domain-containing protein [Anaerolineales bacterium]|nr:DUF3179 domain-containing protein [Anaerolineales bacterium]